MAKKKRSDIGKISDNIASTPIPSTICDTVFGKSVYLSGKKLAGVQSVGITYDIENIVTTVTIKMAIKRDSLQINKNMISFDEAKLDAPEKPA